MKSSEIKFANPKLQEIDFEIKPRPLANFFIGILLLLLAIFIPLAILSIIIYIFSKGVAGNPLFTGFAAALLFSVAALSYFIFNKFFRIARRYFYNPQNLVNDPRAPILYLRSFKDDAHEIALRANRQTPEEILASVFNKIGPVVAVGNPEEKNEANIEKEGLPFLGATRIYLNENWLGEVKKLMKISQFIIINAYDTPGVILEIEAARDELKLAPQKLIFSFLPLQISGGFEAVYRRFDEHFYRNFSTKLPTDNKDVCFLFFDNNLRLYAYKIEDINPDTPASKIKSVFLQMFRHYKLT